VFTCFNILLLNYVLTSCSDALCYGFYRATRMHSADYAVARCPSVCLSVRLSVRLSHAGIESKRLHISSKFFSPSGSPTILVFTYKQRPSFQMVPVWMTFSDLLKVMIIQCQITWKWYNIQLYSQWPTSRKSYTVYRAAPFSMTLNDPYTQFQGHAIFWRWTSQKRQDIQT